MGCTSSKNSKEADIKSNSATTNKVAPIEPVKTVEHQPSTAFEIPIGNDNDDEKGNNQGIKKLPPLSSQKKAESKPVLTSSNQAKNDREKELNLKMERAEKNKQELLLKKKEQGKQRDENIRQVRERRNSMSSDKQ